MNFEAIEKIANAVLYEGYLLYPYRQSALKNRQRWHFGTLEPAGSMQTQCLVSGTAQTAIEVKIRFLQDEVERDVTCGPTTLAADPVRHAFRYDPIEGAIEIGSEPVDDSVFRLTVRILNGSAGFSLCPMLSTHTLLAVYDGAFLSLLDPPDAYRAAAAACHNAGTWPVLAGREGDHHLMLSSPIILYDYPQIAPESAGDFYDATEMDEMLTLRVLTLTDDEKQELREGDERARQILERTEALPPAQMAKLHGAIRSLRNVSKLEFREGDRVRLRPRKRADIFDIALAGKIAVIESIERDFEDAIHLAVTVEDDPGRDLGIARQIGHRFFFSPEEVELL